MKILADENIPMMTVQALREMGHEVLDIRGTVDEGAADEALQSIGDVHKIINYLTSLGYELKDVVKRVVDLLAMEQEEVMASGKHPRTVYARSLLCYWASSELGISQTYLAEKLKISQPAVSLGVNRGKEIAKVDQYSLIGV